MHARALCYIETGQLGRSLALALLAGAPPAAGQISILHGNTEAPSGSIEQDGDRARIRFGYGGRGLPPLEIDAPAGAVERTADGYRVAGDLSIETPGGPLPLLAAELTLGADRAGRLTSLRGRCAVPPPFVSDHVTVASPAMAELGYDLGENIHLGVPLHGNRAFLFFHFEAGFAVEIATSSEEGATPPITLSVPGGADGTMILDPTDSFWFLGGAFLPDDDEKAKDDDGGDDADGDDRPSDDPSTDAGDANDDPNENEDDGPITTGRGRSKQGLIPWSPENARGIEQHVRGFLGHDVQTGSFPIGQLPLMVEGHMVTRFETQSDDGFDPLGTGLPVTYQAGASGDLLLAIPLARMAGVGVLAEFGFGLGRGTAAVEVTADRQHAHFTGYVDPDLSWLPNGTPFRPEGNALVVGYLSTDLPESRIEGWGEVTVDAAFFGRLAGVELEDPLSADGHFLLDRDGLFLSASTSAPVGPLIPLGELAVSARYGAPQASFLRLEGRFAVAGRELAGAVTFDAAGARIEGTLDGDTELVLSGRLEQREGGPALVAQVVLNDDLRAPLAQAAQDRVTEYRGSLETALDELEAAAGAYEFEASLRGIRPALPKICDYGIKQIDGIPGRIKKEWPKKFGVEVPGRSSATKQAKKKAKPLRDQLVKLKSLAGKGDDASLRAALKQTLETVIAKRRLKIKVKVVGTVYDKDVITKSQVTQLRKAVTAVEALPATSARRVSAQQAFDAFPRNAVLDEIQSNLESGLEDALPRIEAITVVLPLSAGTAHAGAWIVLGGDRGHLEVPFDPGASARLGVDVAEAWLASL